MHLINNIRFSIHHFSKLICKSFVSIPNSEDCLTVRVTSADLSSALVGIHPLCKHVPPNKDFSTIATFFLIEKHESLLRILLSHHLKQLSHIVFRHFATPY